MSGGRDPVESRTAWTSALVAAAARAFRGDDHEPLPVDIEDPDLVSLAWGHADPGTQRQFPDGGFPVR